MAVKIAMRYGTPVTTNDKTVGTSGGGTSGTTDYTDLSNKPRIGGVTLIGDITLADINAASLSSPTFTGAPQAPTASAGTSTTQIATTAFVTTAVENAMATIETITEADIDAIVSA